MKFYSKDTLMNVAGHRGYTTVRAVADALVSIFGVSSKTIQNKISYGRFTKEECEVIGSFFEMTMKEYYDVFMHGLFQEDSTGHYVCYVENMWGHLHYVAERKNPSILRKEKIENIISEVDSIK